MTDWDYEERIINDRYSGYKASSRIWELRADKRKEMLGRCKEMLERCGTEFPSFLERHDPELMNELAEELGDD